MNEDAFYLGLKTSSHCAQKGKPLAEFVFEVVYLSSELVHFLKASLKNIYCVRDWARDRQAATTELQSSLLECFLVPKSMTGLHDWALGKTVRNGVHCC